jgi:hypothetical protein
MPLKAQVESLDEVPVEARDFYVESGGKYRIAVEGVEFPEDVAGLKSALEKERESRKAAEKRLAQMPGDFDPARWKEMTETQRKAEEEAAIARGEFAKLREQIQTKHEAALREREEQAGKIASQLDRYIRDEAILRAAAEENAYPNLLPKVVQEFVRVVDEDGERRAVVVDERGQRRLNDRGQDMSIRDLVAWMKTQEEYWPLFRGQGVAGGGAVGRSGTGSPRKSHKDMSEMERVAYIQEHGLDKYRELLNAR